MSANNPVDALIKLITDGSSGGITGGGGGGNGGKPGDTK